jgi:hypothetical protein
VIHRKEMLELVLEKMEGLRGLDDASAGGKERVEGRKNGGKGRGWGLF